jgi:hypothetical protein
MTIQSPNVDTGGRRNERAARDAPTLPPPSSLARDAAAAATSSGRRRRNWLILANVAGWCLIVAAMHAIFF